MPHRILTLLAAGILGATLPALDVGQPAPDLTIWRTFNTTTASSALKISALKGKVVMLDFWGINCPPCVASIPHVEKLYATYKDKPFTVVGYTDDQWSPNPQMAAFIKAKKMSYPIVSGPSVFPKTYDHKGIPAVYLIDHTGVLAWKGHPGQLDEAVITRLVTAATSASASAATSR